VAEALAEFAYEFDVQAVAYDCFASKARLAPECH
jgi:hypothetical protein